MAQDCDMGNAGLAWPEQRGCLWHKESRTSPKAKPELQQGRGQEELLVHRPLDPGEAERRR